MPSVMHTMKLIPAAAASRIAADAAFGGTATNEAVAPVAATASATELKTGMPSTSVPPLPGVTPATTCVPYALLRSPWYLPWPPVRPCTMTLVSLLTKMAMSVAPVGDGDSRAGGFEHGGLGDQLVGGDAGVNEDPPPLLGIGAIEAD